jgi:hypothetical protein
MISFMGTMINVPKWMRILVRLIRILTTLVRGKVARVPDAWLNS